MEIGCKQCGTYEKHEPCHDCGETQHMGDDYRCPHPRTVLRSGFESYWDIQIADHPVWVTNPADRKKYMRPQWKDDHMVHLVDRN